MQRSLGENRCRVRVTLHRETLKRKRAYLLNVAGKSPIWVVISKGKLVVVPEPSGKSTGSGSKHGSGNGSGSGSGGNKPGGGTGGGSPKPGREEDPGEDKV